MSETVSSTTPTTPPSGVQSGTVPQASEPNKTNTPSATASPPELFDVKVNGQVVKMTRQEMHDHASMAFAAEQKFKEASKMRKELEAKKEIYKANPIQALLDFTEGMTPEQRRQILEDYYAKQYIEPETLTAEQRQLRELQEFKRRKEEEEQERQEKERNEAEQKLTHQQREYLQSQIIEAMDKSGLPKTKFFVQRMAFYMRQNLVNGWDAPIEMIIRQVQNERKQIIEDLTQNSSAEQIIQLFGDSLINKIRKYDLEKLRESRNQRTQPFQNSLESPDPVSRKIDYAEVNRRLRDMRTGRFVSGS